MVFLGVGVATEIESAAPLVAIPGTGVLIRGNAKPAVEPMGRCLVDVMRSLSFTCLDAGAIDRLVNWDAEKNNGRT